MTLMHIVSRGEMQYRGESESGKGLSLRRWRVKIEEDWTEMDDYVVVDGCVSG